MFSECENPLESDSPAVWDHLIEAIGPASLIVVIESRMSAALRRQVAAEDIWQDTLLHVWRDRAKCQWRGVRAFRAWVCTVIENRIRDAAERIGAAKRGGGSAPVVFSALQRDASGQTACSAFPGPAGSTTPSRVAVYREQATAMREALNALPEELREVLRLRLFEQASVADAAERLGVTPSVVRHRFRKASTIYQTSLTEALATRTQMVAPQPGSAPPHGSSSNE